MKKTFAILMLVVHLFNIGGHMLLNNYLAYRSDKSASERISKGKYDNDNLVEIKIPQHMPQIHDWSRYLRVSGKVQLNGFAYNYVKLKVTRDTLFVQCVPNYETTKLLTENVIYAKQLSDAPVSKKSNESTVKKSGMDSKYDSPLFNYDFMPFVSAVQKLNTFIFIDIDQPLILIDGRPPEVIA